MQKARAEDQQIVGREGIRFGRNPFPQQLGRRSLSSEVELGEIALGGDLFNAAPGQIDFKIEACLCVPQFLPLRGCLEQ